MDIGQIIHQFLYRRLGLYRRIYTKRNRDRTRQVVVRIISEAEAAGIMYAEVKPNGLLMIDVMLMSWATMRMGMTADNDFYHERNLNEYVEQVNL